MRAFAFSIGLLITLASARAAGRSPVPRLRAPVPVILDTDIGPDVDDVGAVAILNVLADRGEARVLALCCCTSSEWGAPCLQAVSTYYGRPDIPIGTLKQPGFLTQSAYNEAIAKRFPNRLHTGKNAPDATEIYRRVLSRQPESSVAICATGPLVNLRRLLDSPADRTSQLGGRDLVARKVALLAVMGGRYPEGREWNFEQAPAAAAAVVREWPTPILFSGFEIGARIFTGRRLQPETPENNPVRAAYALFPGPGRDRESWDETAVLAAVRGPAAYWNVHATGSNSVDERTGADRWLPQADRAQAYLVERDPPEQVAKAISDLMVAPPRTLNPKP